MKKINEIKEKSNILIQEIFDLYGLFEEKLFLNSKRVLAT
jgi:hypothetical protein